MELRSFATPVPKIKKTFNALLILFGKDVKDWKACQTFIGNLEFLESLDSYDKDSVTPEMIALLKPIMEDPELNSEEVKKYHQTAAVIFDWISEVYQYALTKK